MVFVGIYAMNLVVCVENCRSRGQITQKLGQAEIYA